MKPLLRTALGSLAACLALALASSAPAAPVPVTYALTSGTTGGLFGVGSVTGGSMTVVIPNPGSGPRTLNSTGTFSVTSLVIQGTMGTLSAPPVVLSALAPTGMLNLDGYLNVPLQTFSFGPYLAAPHSSLRQSFAQVMLTGRFANMSTPPGGFGSSMAGSFANRFAWAKRQVTGGGVSTSYLFSAKSLIGQEVAAVPEPASASLLLLGLGGLTGWAAVRRRR